MYDRTCIVIIKIEYTISGQWNMMGFLSYGRFCSDRKKESTEEIMQVD